MKLDISVQNYRCFPDFQPAQFRLGPGFTAFVGVNNSGKSSLLRLFYDLRELFRLLGDDRARDIFAGKPYGLGPTQRTADMFTRLNDRPLKIRIRSDSALPDATSQTGEIVTDVEVIYNRDGSLQVVHQRKDAVNGLGPAVRYPDSELTALMNNLTDCMYIGPFRNILNFAPASGLQRLSMENPVYHDLFIGQQFVQFWRSAKFGNNRNHNELALKITDDLSRIFDLGRLEINPSEGDGFLKIFVDGKSYDLDELGSGLAQFIVVLTNVAFRRPSFVLIDEPELNLHPALQVDFLTTLASYARSGVAFATHNLGLARSVGDPIYSTSRNVDGSSSLRLIEATPRLSEFLGELSFSAHRELGFDKLLLVEGVTEVTTITQFLRKLGKAREVMLLPLNGAATINGRVGPQQIDEIRRITNRIAILIDSERDIENGPLSSDRQAFVDACVRLGVECHVLEKRATENYLTQRAIHASMGSGFRALEPFEPFKGRSAQWAKADNWKIAAEMTREEVMSTDLGGFLQNL